MLSGRRLDLIDPVPGDIEIADIAHGLARVARWNGQTLGAHILSVAQHSLTVEEIACVLGPDWPAPWRLAALLHDAPEYVVGDLISPFKAVIGEDYRVTEKRLLEAVHIRFGLPRRLPQAVTARIKQADRIAAYFEAVGLAGFDEAEARDFFGEPEEVDGPLRARLEALEPWPADKAQAAFLARFEQLAAAVP